jgi:hypothetical protein
MRNLLLFSLRQFLEGGDEVIVENFRDRLTPVLADVERLRAEVAEQRGQQRLQIIAAPFLKFREEIRRPVFARHFQAVAENRIRRIRPARIDRRLGDFFDELPDGVGL